MAVIDICGYCGVWPYWPLRAKTPTDLLNLMDRWKIDRIALTSLKAIFAGCRDGNDETRRVIKEEPSRMIAFAAASPDLGTRACEYIEECQHMGMRGLRLFPQHHRFRLDESPWLASILKMASKLAWPVLIPIRLMMNWGLPTLDVRTIGGIAAAYSHVQFIIGGVNYGELADALAVMNRYNNVAIETSCLQSLGGVKLLADEVGPERVLLGTGLPLQYPSAGLAKIEHAEISDRAKELILGLNAERLLGL
jgi:predicted TIM-barrel fold metal-dependent hydrolase